jgi:hypothetical protein
MPSIAPSGIQETDVTEDSIRATETFLLESVPAVGWHIGHRLSPTQSRGDPVVLALVKVTGATGLS